MARLFKENSVRHIVSFNWDDLIEQAYTEQFGEEMSVVAEQESSSDHALWKLHGDVRIPEQRWVLPYEEGRVFDGLVSQLENEVLLAVIIGYREQEPVVSERLISPLQHRGSIVRIGPSQPNNPPLSFSDDATKALRKLDAGFKAAKQG